MSRRAAAAAIVLALWGAGLATLIRREYFRPHLERLALAAARVNPGAVYFGILRGPDQIGFSSAVIDTARTEIVASDNLVVDLGALGGPARLLIRGRAVFSRGLRLRSFEVTTEGDGPTVRIVGVTTGDSVLQVVTHRDSTRADTVMVRLAGPVLLPSLIPLALALEDRPSVGRRYSYPVFDPATASLREASMIVRAESLFVIADSASFDSTAKRWRATWPDTVRAWRIDTLAGPGFVGWIDAQGQVVHTTRLGVPLTRLPYEVAFNNWKIESDRRAASARDRPPP